MAIDAKQLTIDPIGRPIPGQSLASDKSDLPFERPPATSSVSDALESMLQGMENDVQKENLMNVLEIGMSAETVASSLTMKAFTDGVITPDMAELLKPMLVIAIAHMAEQEGIDYTLVNKPTEVSMDKSEVRSLVKKVSLKDDSDDDEDGNVFSPENILFMKNNEMFLEEDEEKQNELYDDNEEDEIPESTGSFLDISSNMSEEEDMDIEEEEEEI